MAASNCIRCGKGAFEFAPAQPANAAVKVYFVQCSACGGVVGAYPWDHVPALLIQQNKALKKIASNAGVAVDLPGAP